MNFTIYNFGSPVGAGFARPYASTWMYSGRLTLPLQDYLLFPDFQPAGTEVPYAVFLDVGMAGVSA